MTENNKSIVTVNLNGKVVRMQLIVQAAVIGSSDLSDDEKAEYLAHAVRISINGTEQTANLRLSNSNGLAASFMVKDDAVVVSRKLVTEKGSKKGQMKAAATARLRAAFETAPESNV